MVNKEFLGRGWSFPPAFDKALTQVQMLEAEADIKSSLEILLSTALGERIMLPQYGCNMDELVFENLNTTIKTLMKEKIQNALLYHESRVRLEKIELYDDLQLDGIIMIDMIYIVKSTNSRFNFVYPFYKREGTDINLAATINLLPDAN
jgi:phage baseplate assembly protein W